MRKISVDQSKEAPLNEGLEETTPDPTPPVEINPENALYQEWKIAEALARPAIAHRLLQHLRRHAAKVCWMVLHANHIDLIDEISQDAVLDLDSFEGRSAFATWFHARALNRCRAFLRQQRRRREVPLDSVKDRVGFIASSLETRVIVQDLIASLPQFERDLINFKIVEGLPDIEIAKKLGFTRDWIQISWSKLRKQLKEKYNGSSEVR